jgi:hypothetical protein
VYQALYLAFVPQASDSDEVIDSFIARDPSSAPYLTRRMTYDGSTAVDIAIDPRCVDRRRQRANAMAIAARGNTALTTIG